MASADVVVVSLVLLKIQNQNSNGETELTIHILSVVAVVLSIASPRRRRRGRQAHKFHNGNIHLKIFTREFTYLSRGGGTVDDLLSITAINCRHWPREG